MSWQGSASLSVCSSWLHRERVDSVGQEGERVKPDKSLGVRVDTHYDLEEKEG